MVSSEGKKEEGKAMNRQGLYIFIETHIFTLHGIFHKTKTLATLLYTIGPSSQVMNEIVFSVITPVYRWEI